MAMGGPNNKADPRDHIKVNQGTLSRTMVYSVSRNFGLLTLGRMLGETCTFLFFVVLSRAFGQHGIGQYSLAIGLTGFFAVFADFGLYQLSIKEVGRRSSSLKDYYSRIFLLRLILSLTAFGALLLLLPFLPFPRETKLVIVLIGAYQVIYKMVSGLGAMLIGRGDGYLAGLLELCIKVITALAATAVLMAGGNLVAILATFPAITFAGLAIAYLMVNAKHGNSGMVATWSSLKGTLLEAIPYALSLFLAQVSSRTDIVLLGFFLGAAAAGVYNVAYRAIFFLLFVTQCLGITLFPLASRLYLESRSELEVLYNRSINLIILIGLPAASGLWLTAPNLINLIFGGSFGESALVLRFLAGLLFLTSLSRIMGIFLMSCDRQLDMTKSQWIVASVNVLGNLALIPAFGIKGAATATLISEALLVSLFALQLRAVVGWPKMSSRLVIGSIGAASFCLPFLLLPSVPLLVLIPTCVLLYSGTLVVFKETRRSEVHALVSLLKRHPSKVGIDRI